MTTAPTLRGPRLWLRAFVGFYPPHDPAARGLDPVARFLFSARSVILVISAQAAVIAGLLAAAARRFDLPAFALVLVGFVTAHMISNLLNDYFGYHRGDDTPDSPRMRYTMHPFAGGVLDRRTFLAGMAILAAVGTSIVAYFWMRRGPLALAFAAAGLLVLYLYDAAPRTLKDIGLGEIAAFTVWGPLMVGGGYVVITGQIRPEPFLVSVPYGLGVMSILMGKHIDQLDFDAPHGHRTLPVILGERLARRCNQAIVAGMYAITALLIAAGILTPWAALVATAAPRGWQALRILDRPRPSSPPPGYVGWPLWYHRVSLVHNRRFGWAYIGGLALGTAVTLLR
ncbi:MAG: prenyltransferase [Armatimonadota bacterium]|nr:prenyltransferase [Armatimonadota bacterium]MDR7401168.1 prenyltransferase [Armatimonadota bacterium]MDR7403412.1 prenyltransferase [Armatimonadota bacterium]MDR7438017.1 prenyltransferase [Armatimonadota bacterium]MDR7471823.1 prenyltransferase [Armatimonadota bacterium]